MPLYFLMAKIDFVLTHMPRLSVSLSIFYRYFLILFLGTLMGCQQNIEYTYITGGGRCANGKQDPDEFGVDCGGACSQSCENLRYLEGEIFGRMYLEKRFDYVLTGPLIVRDQASLEFPAGTHLKVQADVGAYIAVVQGGSIFSWGKPDSPVTISSNAPEPSAGDWGGIIICGQAPLESAERKFTPIGNYYYGGNNPNDGSGSLRYLKIEHAGAVYNEEFNFSALSLYGTGRLTPMHHIWVDDVLHNGVEISGGNIEVDNLVVTRAQQNALTITSNWGGEADQLFLHQSGNNGIKVHDPALANTISSSFTLSKISINDASTAAIGISSQLSSANFDRFLITNTPLGFDFSPSFSATFPIQWENISLQNVTAVSNDPSFNAQFNSIAILPFENANQLPAWLSNWEN